MGDVSGAGGVGRRIGCVWVPRFGLSVARRLDPLRAAERAPARVSAGGLRGPAIGGGGRRPQPSLGLAALYQPGTRWQEVLECSPELQALGVRPGSPLKEAQARVPDAAYLPSDAATLAAIAEAFEAVVEALDAFSPVVELAPVEAVGRGHAVVYLDIAGLAALYGPEPRLAERLVDAAEAASGCPARAGIASGKFSAWVAATLADAVASGQWPVASGQKAGRRGDAGTRGADAPRPGVAAGAELGGTGGLGERSMVVPPGEEALFLAPLPLETLPLAVLPLQSRLALQRLGVRTLGAYARLPPNAAIHRRPPGPRPGREPTGARARVADAASAAGQRAHALAQGIDDEPLRPRRPRPAARVEVAFEWEETELDRLRFVLKALADQLAARLEALDEEARGKRQETRREGEVDEEAWPEDDEPPDQPPDPDAPPDAATARGGLRTIGRAPRRTSPDPPRPGGYAAEALRVVWRLSGGEQREALLRLAEPACSAAAFAEHLRWHAEGLDRFLAADQPDSTPVPPPAATPAGAGPRRGPPRPGTPGQAPEGYDQASRTVGRRSPHRRPLAPAPRFATCPLRGPPGPPALPGGEGTRLPDQPEPLNAPAPEGGEGLPDLAYEPMEHRRGVVGIALEAVGLRVPEGTQLKLLASPLSRLQLRQAGSGSGGEVEAAYLDPATRAHHARRAIARLQARWGPEAVRQVVSTPSRLPERAFRAVEPSIGLQVGARSLWEPGAHGGPPPRAVAERGGGGVRAAARVRIGRSPHRRPPPASGPPGPPALPEGEGMRADDAAALVGHVPLWLVDPPEPVRVLNPRQKGGRASLARAGAAGQPAQGAQRAKRGLRIVTHGGPWKLVDPTPLATGDPLQRDYYQVEAEDGRAYLIYWDRVSDSWFLQGIFD